MSQSDDPTSVAELGSPLLSINPEWHTFAHLVPRNNEGHTAWDNGDYADEGFLPFYPPPSSPCLIEVVIAPFPVYPDERTCSICLDELAHDDDLCILNCAHLFCVDCIHRHIHATRNHAPNCPVCRADIIMVQVQDNEVATIFDDVPNR